MTFTPYVSISDDYFTARYPFEVLIIIEHIERTS